MTCLDRYAARNENFVPVVAPHNGLARGARRKTTGTSQGRPLQGYQGQRPCLVRCPALILVVLVVFAKTGAAQTVNPAPPGAGGQEAEGDRHRVLPSGLRSFRPLLADPKEARSFASFVRGSFRPTRRSPSGARRRLRRWDWATALDWCASEGRPQAKACSSTPSAASSRSSTLARRRPI